MWKHERVRAERTHLAAHLPKHGLDTIWSSQTTLTARPLHLQTTNNSSCNLIFIKRRYPCQHNGYDIPFIHNQHNCQLGHFQGTYILGQPINVPHRTVPQAKPTCILLISITNASCILLIYMTGPTCILLISMTNASYILLIYMTGPTCILLISMIGPTCILLIYMTGPTCILLIYKTNASYILLIYMTGPTCIILIYITGPTCILLLYMTGPTYILWIYMTGPTYILLIYVWPYLYSINIYN